MQRIKDCGVPRSKRTAISHWLPTKLRDHHERGSKMIVIYIYYSQIYILQPNGINVYESAITHRNCGSDYMYQTHTGSMLLKSQHGWKGTDAVPHLAEELLARDGYTIGKGWLLGG